jgi:hypothetical protein
MVAYSLKLNRTKLQGVGMKRAKSLVTRVTRKTFSRSQALVPVDTGNLRASGWMTVEQNGPSFVTGTILYTAEYAAAVHNGRRALTIRPKRAGGKLKFTVGGKTVYARQVHQPARAARPYLATALREVAGGAQDFTVTIG